MGSIMAEPKVGQCPTLSLMHIMGKSWTIPIMEAFEYPAQEVQFSDLEGQLPGITAKNLSKSLKELCSAQLIAKTTKAEGKAIYTRYSITKKGLSFQKFITEGKKLGICIYGIDPSCAKRKCTQCQTYRLHSSF